MTISNVKFVAFFVDNKIGWLIVFLISIIVAIIAIVIAVMSFYQVDGRIDSTDNLRSEGVGMHSLVPFIKQRLLNMQGCTSTVVNNMGSATVRISPMLDGSYTSSDYSVSFSSSDCNFNSFTFVEKNVNGFTADVTNVRTDHMINSNIQTTIGSNLVPFTFDNSSALQQDGNGNLQVVALQFGNVGIGAPPTEVTIFQPESINAVTDVFTSGPDILTIPSGIFNLPNYNAITSGAIIAFDANSMTRSPTTDKLTVVVLLTSAHGSQDIGFFRVDAGNPVPTHAPPPLHLTLDDVIKSQDQELVRVGDYDLLISQQSQIASSLGQITADLKYCLGGPAMVPVPLKNTLNSVDANFPAARKLFSVIAVDATNAMLIQPAPNGMMFTNLALDPTGVTETSIPSTLPVATSADHEYNGLLYQTQFVERRNRPANMVEFVCVYVMPLNAIYNFVVIKYTYDLDTGVITRDGFMYESRGVFSTDFRVNYILYDNEELLQIYARKSGSLALINPMLPGTVLPTFPGITSPEGKLIDAVGGDFVVCYTALPVKNPTDNTDRLVTIRNGLVLAYSGVNDLTWTTQNRILN